MKKESSKSRDKKSAPRPKGLVFHKNHVEHLSAKGQREGLNASPALALDHGFDPATFSANLNIAVLRKDRNDLEVEIKGIDAPVANALRRIMIDEVS